MGYFAWENRGFVTDLFLFGCAQRFSLLQFLGQIVIFIVGLVDVLNVFKVYGLEPEQIETQILFDPTVVLVVVEGRVRSQVEVVGNITIGIFNLLLIFEGLLRILGFVGGEFDQQLVVLLFLLEFVRGSRVLEYRVQLVSFCLLDIWRLRWYGSRVH
jgi:hypothetical protein